jgi:hypothetical protein
MASGVIQYVEDFFPIRFGGYLAIDARNLWHGWIGSC